MARLSKEDLGAPKKRLTPEDEQFMTARQARWAEVHAAVEAGNAEAAKAAIQLLMQEATENYRRKEGSNQ